MAAGYSNLVEFYEREAVGGTGAAGTGAAGGQGGGSGEKMDHGDTPSPLVGVKLVFPPATPVTVAAASSSPSEAALQGNHTPAADECVHMLPCCCCCCCPLLLCVYEYLLVYTQAAGPLYTTKGSYITTARTQCRAGGGTVSHESSSAAVHSPARLHRINQGSLIWRY